MVAAKQSWHTRLMKLVGVSALAMAASLGPCPALAAGPGPRPALAMEASPGPRPVLSRSPHGFGPPRRTARRAGVVQR